MHGSVLAVKTMVRLIDNYEQCDGVSDYLSKTHKRQIHQKLLDLK